MNETRLYARSKSNGIVGYIDNNVTATEITEYEKEEKQRKIIAQEKEKKEKELLSLCGLTHGDFVRFRCVWREGNELVVETRENGVHQRSVNAIRNVNYMSSEPDDFDSTYEYYTFKIPVEGGKP